MCRAGCRIDVVETQHSVMQITAVLRSRNLGQAIKCCLFLFNTVYTACACRFEICVVRHRSGGAG